MVFTFAQSNPDGPTEDDIPALLRRIADSISQYDGIDVRDIVFHPRYEDDKPSVTVYFVASGQSPS